MRKPVTASRITPYSVVFENARRIERMYDGHIFPPYADKAYLMEFTAAPLRIVAAESSYLAFPMKWRMNCAEE